MIDPTDLRKAALSAFVAGTVHMICSSLHLVLSTIALGQEPWLAEFTLVPTVVISLPGLVLLFLLYRTGVKLGISSRLRGLAFVLVFVEGAEAVNSVRIDWIQGLHLHAANRMTDLGLAHFYQSGGYSGVLDAIEICSILAGVLFLFALSRQTGPPQTENAGKLHLVRKAAMVTLCARSLRLLLIVLFAVSVYSLRSHGLMRQSSTSPSSLLMRIVFALPGLLAAWIVYRSAAPPASTSS